MRYPPPRDPTSTEQENVWDFPRPARLEANARHLQVVLAGRIVAETRQGFRAIETSHPPSYYFPPGDVDLTLLVPASRRTLCEWKGGAVYHDLVVGPDIRPDAAWSYPRPTADFLAAADHIAFYPARVDACFVDGERVIPQAGSFYGGWITRFVAGPFKGPPGTSNW
ncbi:hypothetical protein ASG43_05450 [Aureimonas sp. Leaf454]|uniref:DUF427 domain-containing protein n=1 Tax=Aureimonas sp. Leaf454 TaxID=1736381 RepID=UPI0006F6EA71|nr:DUF427 domain-containing protein [Aureimonas sp. Leaf454]KQT50726.1 hypothetical protein ASG43_05450 [Aureimonas sp. Leaf454]